MKIYAAVIEWPSDYADYGEPGLIIERSREARLREIRATVHEFARAFAPDVKYAQRLQAALAEIEDLDDGQWLAKASLYDEIPLISLHKRTV